MKIKSYGTETRRRAQCKRGKRRGSWYGTHLSPCRLFHVLFSPFPPFAPSSIFAARLRKCRPAARLFIFFIPPRRIYCASRRWSSAFPCGARRTARLTPLLFPAREERDRSEQRESAEASRAAAAASAARRRGFGLRRRLRLARPHDDRRVRYYAFRLVKVE